MVHPVCSKVGCWITRHGHGLELLHPNHQHSIAWIYTVHYDCLQICRPGLTGRLAVQFSGSVATQDPSCLFTRLESLGWSQQGFWQPSFWRKRNLWSLCYDGGSLVLLLFTAYLEERWSIKKLEGWIMDMSLLFFSYVEAMKINSILVFPSKQRLHKLRFLQKLGCQKPRWDQARFL